MSKGRLFTYECVRFFILGISILLFKPVSIVIYVLFFLLLVFGLLLGFFKYLTLYPKDIFKVLGVEFSNFTLLLLILLVYLKYAFLSDDFPYYYQKGYFSFFCISYLFNIKISPSNHSVIKK